MTYTAMIPNKMTFTNFVEKTGVFVGTVQCTVCDAVCELNKETDAARNNYKT